MSIPTRTEVMKRLDAAKIPYRKRDNLKALLALLEKPAAAKPVRKHSDTPVTTSTGIRCRHCGHVSDHHHSTHKYSNGNWRALCKKCNRPFIVIPKYKKQ